MIVPFILGVPVVLLFTYWGFNLTDLAYSKIYGKPLIVYDHIYFKKLEEEDVAIIKRHSVFYNNLNKYKQRVFRHRVVMFINSKTFIGLDGFECTREKKILIASIAVMLSFGMRRYLIESVNKIIVYPEAYFSAITQKYHLGEFNPLLKTIVFSWKDFKAGLNDNNNNSNLGVHEFAHALYFASKHYNDVSSILFAHGIKKIDDLLYTDVYIDKIRHTKYLRGYAFANKFEFFAVCLEHFIETPVEFKKEFPELFIIIKNMMNFETSIV
ncbi:zinc-dependent peptidase [Galbibacter mesophilus]|uniref:zinc-dependent peptidase n=1 Tax=Galbibacter mesophilus TaxID=379069 RepID=UPI00191D74DC|nr:zinc-dependent peptidase [Galbibacter mesophilus]MCM5664429.1 zinc-dependent peptidase [Galbibacter mesophilus]